MGTCGVFNFTLFSASQFRLRRTAIAWLALLFLLTGATLYRLIIASVDKERSHRQELFDSDLRELAGRLDADERYVLEHNLAKLLPEDRPIQPLLLPRQYFVNLPIVNSSSTPRPPPQNCYLDLINSASNSVHDSNPDRFCSYFTSNRALGSYLFLDMTFSGRSVTTLRTGDITLTADAIRLSVSSGKYSGVWWLTLQLPRHAPLSSQKFEITSIFENTNGKKERDRRIEGWAYQQQQPNGVNIMHLIARMDFHAIVPLEPQQLEVLSQQPVTMANYRGGRLKHRSRTAVTDPILEPWPPKGWENINIELARKSINADTRQATITTYSPQGLTNLSVSALSAPFVNAYAKLRIRQSLDSGVSKLWTPPTPAALNDKFSGSNSWIHIVDGDLLIQQSSPLVRERIIPDTNLIFEVTHPGTVVEKGVWQTAMLLSVILLGFFFLARLFWTRLLRPIGILSTKAKTIANSPVESEQELPYGSNRDEVGTLSTAFNELLKETRIRAARAQLEGEMRNEETRQRHLEDVRIREVSLQTIGHEIRSPLQALLGLHQIGDPSRRYVDRMIRAVDHLFGKAGPSSFDAVPINLQKIDIAEFLSDQATNAATAQSPITNVDYIGPPSGVVCLVDPDAFEDTVAHILENAARFRIDATPIRIHLSQDDDITTICICNEGPQIPDNLLDKIFEFGISPTENRNESNQGIGLYVAKNYVSRMSGKILARNMASGVEFIISLPLDKQHPNKDFLT